jgi:septum formation protein
MINRPIILASQSPRRHQLLRDAGFDFEVRIKSIDEVFPEDMNPSEVAEYLAVLKAEAVRDWIIEDEIIITADSVVLLDNVIYGKPTDSADAFQMIKKLSSKTHQVITGVCMVSKEGTIRFSDITNVFFDEMSDDEIHYYINNFKPFDKAGAYGIQEWIGYTKIHKIEGSYSNVMGLPIHRVYRELMKFKTN